MTDSIKIPVLKSWLFVNARRTAALRKLTRLAPSQVSPGAGAWLATNTSSPSVNGGHPSSKP